MAKAWSAHERTQLYDAVNALSDEQSEGIQYILSHLQPVILSPGAVRPDAAFSEMVAPSALPAGPFNTLVGGAAPGQAPSHMHPAGLAGGPFLLHPGLLSMQSPGMPFGSMTGHHGPWSMENSNSGFNLMESQPQPAAMKPADGSAGEVQSDPFRTVDLTGLAPAVCDILHSFTSSVDREPIALAKTLVKAYYARLGHGPPSNPSAQSSPGSALSGGLPGTHGAHAWPVGRPPSDGLPPMGVWMLQESAKRSTSSTSNGSGSSTSSTSRQLVAYRSSPSRTVGSKAELFPHPMTLGDHSGFPPSAQWHGAAEFSSMLPRQGSGDALVPVPHIDSAEQRRPPVPGAVTLVPPSIPLFSHIGPHTGEQGMPLAVARLVTSSSEHQMQVFSPPAQPTGTFNFSHVPPHLISRGSSGSDFTVAPTPSASPPASSHTSRGDLAASGVYRLVTSFSEDNMGEALPEKPAAGFMNFPGDHVADANGGDGMALISMVAEQELVKAASGENLGDGTQKPILQLSSGHDHTSYFQALALPLRYLPKNTWVCPRCHILNTQQDDVCLSCDASQPTNPKFVAMPPAVMYTGDPPAPAQTDMTPEDVGDRNEQESVEKARMLSKPSTRHSAGTKRSRMQISSGEGTAPSAEVPQVKRKATTAPPSTPDQYAFSPSPVSPAVSDGKSKSAAKKGSSRVHASGPTCPECGKSFRSHSDVEAHRRTHTGEKPLECSFPGCMKRFAHISNLKVHERSHQGIKPYACTYPGCTKAYRHPSSRDDHYDSAHLGLRKYKCTEAGCDRSFTAVANLNRHRRTAHRLEGGKGGKDGDADDEDGAELSDED